MRKQLRSGLLNPPLMAQAENGEWHEIVSGPQAAKMLGLTVQMMSAGQRLDDNGQPVDPDFPKTACILGRSAYYYWKEDIEAEVKRRNSHAAKRKGGQLKRVRVGS